MAKNPNRGEVWLVDLGLAAKVRSCLVFGVSLEDEDRALVTLLPHTTGVYGSRFEVDVQARFLKSGVFDAQNLITIPSAKLIRRLGDLTSQQLAAVEEVVRRWLGL
jgi:mRNA interferase MazF